MTYDDCMDAILANPEDDRPRHELAKVLASTDPERADFIARQLVMSKRMRDTYYQPGVGRIGSITHEESRFLDTHRYQWSRDIGFYMGEINQHRVVEFSRGLPWLCSMNPYIFLEQGEYAMTKIAPLRGIEFFPDPEGEPFPAAKLAACPWLARLDEIRFFASTLGNGDLELLAASPHLKRVRMFDIRSNQRTLGAFEALAANPETRKCLTIRDEGGGRAHDARDSGPIGEFSHHDETGTHYYEMSEEGRALERRHGYVPWLHSANEGAAAADASYWVEQRVLPVFAPGSPASAPTHYGKGLYPVPALQPRADFFA